MEDQGLYLKEFETANCGAGFICNLHGKTSHSIIHNALDILVRLEHRGAVSADGKTGDGAGILIDIPHDYFARVCEFPLPNFREYAVGMLFMPTKTTQQRFCKEIFETELNEQNISILGWRKVPVNNAVLGSIAAETEPAIVQVFLKKQSDISDFEFQKKLYAARKVTEQKIARSKLSQANYFYVSSLSTRTIIYKGLLIPEDIGPYYLDLQETDVVTRLALVHQRFSTNTFPAWELAQPFRYLCHNGEINTLKGNISRMKAREELMASPAFQDKISDMVPIIPPGKSDSASMDMAAELLLMTGRTLPEALMMMVPEAWEKAKNMNPKKKAFYEYHSCIMEPWDGPASIPFTDGNYIGAILDRNGLRPSRYTVTTDGLVIMASETGVIEVPPHKVVKHGRLEPGKMFLVDMNEGRIVEDSEIKNKIVDQYPYETWLEEHRLPLAKIPYTQNPPNQDTIQYQTRLKAFGYTTEDIQTIISPMLTKGKEAIGSMGTDTPLAVLSSKPQLLYNYFKQLFAQVTNPPLDGIREEIITDISLAIGGDRNIFDIVPEQAKKLRIQNPVISNEDLDKIKHIHHPDFSAVTLPLLYKINKGVNGLEHALEQLLFKAEKAVDAGANILILSDRNITAKKAAIPALLACSFLHHSLNQKGKRSKFGIVIETAEAREPHHFATLFGYGASAINPYLVNEIITHEVTNKNDINLTKQTAIANYNTAIGKGILKIMNKIGISTLHSYRASQIFEILGLKKSFVNKYFPNTPSRIEGIGLYVLEKDISKRHRKAFDTEQPVSSLALPIGGDYRWRRTGEHHLFNPNSIAKLQQAVRSNSKEKYRVYAELINNQSKQLMTLRGLLEFTNLDPIPIEEVEPWTAIVKRFKTGAMSLGSISQEAHENLALAMNRIGGKSNSGEGGEAIERSTPLANGDSKNSAIKQVASGRFGVSSYYLSTAKEIQIKMAQGAKPGEGGQLPGEKVFPWIAKVRNSTPFVGLISPPPHHDIYSIEDLAQLIYDLKNANRHARINVKLVSKVGVGTIAAGVAKAKADVILVSGYDGGTGASPLTSLKHAGLPWELGIAEAQQTLVLNNLRSRVVLECDGQLKTGRDVAIAALLGAEEFGFATAPLVASGCIMMRACHLNTCPVGIATQDPELRKNFKGTPEHVINFMYFVAEELREIMATLGFRTLDDMVGQVQKLQAKKAIEHYKAKGIDVSALLFRPNTDSPVRNTTQQNHHLEQTLDHQIIKDILPKISLKKEIKKHYHIKNTHRSVGTMLSYELSKRFGPSGLTQQQVQLQFEGSAGQSFGAFLTNGVTLALAGDTNDYLGKGLSGGTLIISKPTASKFKAHENIITGNVSLYGAIAGEVYINGLAGERFAVRNSGAHAVVEGLGDHGCEYMTGGRVFILGAVGKNFGAGMSGGIAYIYQPTTTDHTLFNTESIDLDPLNFDDKQLVLQYVKKHYECTKSDRARFLLENWHTSQHDFIKVFPKEYKKIVQEQQQNINQLTA